MPGKGWTVSMVRYFAIIAGGGIGAAARFALGSWVGQRWGRSFPLGTFVINVSGCFLVGLLMTLMIERFSENPLWRLFLVVGVLGGYTTFSSFEYEAGRLVSEGEYLYAALNAVLNVAVGFAALKVGETLAKII